jgi:hypothetical protein
MQGVEDASLSLSMTEKMYDFLLTFTKNKPRFTNE